MAETKVTIVVLKLKDEMSSGLVKAARNTKDVNKEMVNATQKVVDFRKKGISAINKFSKATAKVATSAVGAFLEMDDATKGYRISQGNLATAFQAAGHDSETATKAYTEFYKILGDNNTATEASQKLARLTMSEKDVTTWTNIAAGVLGSYGDDLPIEELIEAANETVKVGTVTGALANALKWAGINEEDFNKKLGNCTDESERNKLIMDTLSGAYQGAADSFKKNNEQIIKSNEAQLSLNDTMATLGDSASKVKNGLATALGANQDGTIRAGSAFEFVKDKAEELSAKIDEWTANGVIDQLASKFDTVLATGIDTASNAFRWVLDNKDSIATALQMIGAAFAVGTVLQFVNGIVSAANTIGALVKISGVLLANPIVLGIGLAIAAGVMLYQNWDKIKEGASALWEKTTQVFGGIKDSIVGAFDAAKEKVFGFFSWLEGKLEDTPILGNIYKKGKDALGWFGNLFSESVPSNNKNALGTSANIVRAVNSFASPSGHALGTSYWRGGLTHVNERGGEIINLPNGSQVIPHDLSKRALGGGYNINVQVAVQGNVIGNKQFAYEIGEEVAGQILHKLDNIS